MLPRHSRSFDYMAVPTARAILTRPAYRIIRNDTLEQRITPSFRFIGQRRLLRCTLWDEQASRLHPFRHVEMVSRLLNERGT